MPRLQRALQGNKIVIVAIAAMSVLSGAFVIVLFSHRIFSFACRAFAVWPKVKENLMRLHYDIVLLKGKQSKGWEAITEQRDVSGAPPVKGS